MIFNERECVVFGKVPNILMVRNNISFSICDSVVMNYKIILPKNGALLITLKFEYCNTLENIIMLKSETY